MNGVTKKSLSNGKLNLVLAVINLVYLLVGLWISFQDYFTPSIGLVILFELVIAVSLFTILYMIFAVNARAKSKLTTPLQTVLYWINNIVCCLMPIAVYYIPIFVKEVMQT